MFFSFTEDHHMNYAEVFAHANVRMKREGFEMNEYLARKMERASCWSTYCAEERYRKQMRNKRNITRKGVEHVEE